jgi:hypothetical protein
MEEREGPRIVTQRLLAEGSAEPPVANPTSSPEPKPPAATGALPGPPAPSNRGLLERQRRWFRERGKFEARRPENEGPK